MIRMIRIRTIRINLIQTRSQPSFLIISRYDLPLGTIRPLISPTSPSITNTFWCLVIRKNTKKGRAWWPERASSRYKKASFRLAFTLVLTMGPLPWRILSLTEGRFHWNRIAQMSWRFSDRLRIATLLTKTSHTSPPIRSNHRSSHSSSQAILSTLLWAGLRTTCRRYSMKMRSPTDTLLKCCHWRSLWRTDRVWAKATQKSLWCWGSGPIRLIILRAQPTLSVTRASKRKRRNHQMNQIEKICDERSRLYKSHLFWL